MADVVFTIGHSNHTLEHFISLLKLHNVNAVGDVRSVPYSRMNAQFDREDLQESLRRENIVYVFLGEQLGARTSITDCYEDGTVRYDRLARTNAFRAGLERVKNGMKRFRLALMCAEKDPLQCHRTILIAPPLEGLGVSVSHIHANGALESNAHAIDRLIRQLRIPGMFLDKRELIAEAYRVQESKIAYSQDHASSRDLEPKRAIG